MARTGLRNASFTVVVSFPPAPACVHVRSPRMTSGDTDFAADGGGCDRRSARLALFRAGN
jgi:hypothetical protein